MLIAEGFVLKIADFGLARNISGTDFYKKNPRVSERGREGEGGSESVSE